ncbi:MAG: hypothetical protein WBQ44_13110, partial [Rhodococcus sp. (in: high G+C Gram-positive bacteria)]
MTRPPASGVVAPDTQASPGPPSAPTAPAAAAKAVVPGTRALNFKPSLKRLLGLLRPEKALLGVIL